MSTECVYGADYGVEQCAQPWYPGCGVKSERDALMAEVEHLRRGIEAYRATTPCHIAQCGWPECPSCLWEREDEKRREEGGDER